MALTILHGDQAEDALWRNHKEIFNQVYLVEGKSLSQVKQLMESDHGFPELP